MRAAQAPTSARNASARERITAAAGQLLRRQGYGLTALKDIVATSRAPKGSLYYYFPGGKEQIAAEAIEKAAASVSATIAKVLERSHTLPDAFDMFAQLLARNLEASDFHDGCPVATTTLKMAAGGGLVGEACSKSFADWEILISARLAASGYDERKAQHLAVLVLSAFEGALVVARARHDTTPLVTVAETLTAALVQSQTTKRGADGHE